MRSRVRAVRAAAMLAGLALFLGACSYGNDDTNTLGKDPYVTEGGTQQVFALYDPGIQVLPMPNDVTWASSDGKVAFPIEEGDTLAQLKQLINGLELEGLSPNMFLTVPVSGAVDPTTVELIAFRTDDPQLPALLMGLAAEDPTAIMTALAQMEIRTEADFVAVAGQGVLKLLPHTPLTPGAAYAVALKAGSLEDTLGYPVTSSIVMRALKSQTPFPSGSPFANLEPLRAKYNDPDTSTEPPTPSLFDVVQGVTTAENLSVQQPGWTRDDILVLWTFHTADRTLSLTPTTPGEDTATYPIEPGQQGDTFAATGAAMRGITTLFTQNNLEWRALDAQFQPTVSVATAADAKVDAATLLTPQGIPSDALDGIYFGVFQSPVLTTAGATSEGVTFLIATPNAAEPAEGYPVVLFQHGIGSSKEAALAIANSLAQAGFATLAIDAPFHGGRTLPGETSGTGFFTTNLIEDRAHIYQSAMDLWETLDVIGEGIYLDADAAEDLNPDQIQFAAHSLGSIIGSVFLSQEGPGDLPPGRVHRMLLSSPSAELANVLDDTAIEELQGLVTGLGYTKGTTPYYVFLNIAQWLLDPVDGAYARIGSNPVDNLLTNFAYGDPIVSVDSTLTFLTNLGVDLADVVHLDPAEIVPGTVPPPAAGAYEYGVAGTPIVHSFLLSPLFDPAEEPYYAGYDPAAQLSATRGAQAQAAGFFAAP